MKSSQNKLTEVFKKYDIHKYQNAKVNNVFPIFNLLLTINVLIMSTSLGVIIAHLIVKFS